MWVSCVIRSNSTGSRLNGEGGPKGSSLASRLARASLEEALPMSLRKDLVKLIEVRLAGLEELLEEERPSLHLLVYRPFVVGWDAPLLGDPVLQQVAVHIARRLMGVVVGVPAVDLDEREGVCGGVVA